MNMNINRAKIVPAFLIELDLDSLIASQDLNSDLSIVLDFIRPHSNLRTKIYLYMLMLSYNKH
jgi:hypothetical protein